MLKPLKLAVIAIPIFAAVHSEARTVVSKVTGRPVAYANVGVINRNIGTVTDTLGNFHLEVPEIRPDDSLRISSIGYESITFALSDAALIPDTIRLAEKAIQLGEIEVKPERIRQRTAGREKAGGFIYLNVEGYKAAGQGLATPLKVKSRAWLKELGFTILDNASTLSGMHFRINVYRKEDGKYIKENIEPQYFTYSRNELQNGKFSYVFPTEIMLEKGDYYIELEFLENFQNEYFIMTSRPLTGKTRYRYASESDWETLPFGAPIYVVYDTVE